MIRVLQGVRLYRLTRCKLYLLGIVRAHLVIVKSSVGLAYKRPQPQFSSGNSIYFIYLLRTRLFLFIGQ